MIITQNKKSVVRSHDFEETSCTIDAEDMRYVASLLRNNYSNPTFATIRETIANAVDANNEANSPREIEITLPTSLNPAFIVRDFGEGLSKRDMRELYSKFGKSTKRCSNSYIGGFGIGKFAPLSYGDSFVVTSFHNGMEVSYNVFIDANEDTKLSKLCEMPYKGKDTGLQVKVAVADDDVENFRNECLKFLQFFSEKPKVIGLGDDEIPQAEISIQGTDFFFTEENQTRHGYNAHAIMGDVVYPIDPNSISGVNPYADDNVSRLLNCASLFIRFPIGSLKLHHSRESLEYTKETQSLIKDRVEEITKEMRVIATEKLKKAKDLWEAKLLYNSIVNSMDYQLRAVFKNAFQWQGIEIDSAYFTKVNLPSSSYRDDDMIIKRMTKSEDSGVTDGYKIKTTRDNYMYAEKNCAICIDDCESPHGQALRARTLFRQDEDLSVVYLLQFRNKACYKHFCKVSSFNKVSKSRVKKLSSIEKAKVGRGSSTGSRSFNSRASVQVFEFDAEARNYRNSDFWDDSKKDTSSEGGVFVPIFNYRWVNVSTNEEVMPLSSLSKTLKSMKGMGLSVPKIFGIRVKDVAKLKDSEGEWVNAKDFLLDKIKGMLSDKKSLKAMVDFDALSDHKGGYELHSVENSKVLWDAIKDAKIDPNISIYRLIEALQVIKPKVEEKSEKVRNAMYYAKLLDPSFKLDNLPESEYNMSSLRAEVLKEFAILGRLSYHSWGDSSNDAELAVNFIKQIVELNRLREIEMREISFKKAV